ncbi:MAG: DUF2807 domain-containing protein [Paludibacteraceae bacterium]|nr:DUF2807 domain-containing protein [Paludibacteraceae bacterium]
MKTTVNVNLAGLAYTLDKDAYETLNAYLEDIESRLSQDESKEVLEDIEARISELIGQKMILTTDRVVTLALLRPILNQIGQPSDFGQTSRPKVKPRSKTPMSPLAKLLLFIAGAISAVPLAVLLFVIVIVCIVFFSIGMAFAVPIVGMVCVLMVIIMPVYMIIHTIVCLIRDKAMPKAKFWIITLLLWIASIIGTCIIAIKGGFNFQEAQDVVAIALHDYENNDEGPACPLIVEDGWHSVKVSDACAVEITKDSICSFVLNKPLGVQAWVEDSVLHITGLTNRRHLAQVTMSELRSLVVKDASRATVKGHFGTVTMRVSDASKVEATESEIEHLTICCTDASKALVNVTGTLDAQAKDASRIRYKGKPILLGGDTQDLSSIKPIK